MKIRRLTEEGLSMFSAWLADGQGDDPPSVLISGDIVTEPCFDEEVDESHQFTTRYDFGVYLVRILAGHSMNEIMDETFDAMWAWLSVVYFKQLRKKNKKSGRFQSSEHFIVERRGIKGSLAYRQAPRTCYELVQVHGEAARVCLARPIDTFGDIAEQLASRSYLARNRGFIGAAARLYVRNDTIVRGAGSYPIKPSKRKEGDRKGYGGVRRLEQRLSKLELTYDAASMTSDEIVDILPKEFSKFKPTAAAKIASD